MTNRRHVISCWDVNAILLWGYLSSLTCTRMSLSQNTGSSNSQIKLHFCNQYSQFSATTPIQVSYESYGCSYKTYIQLSPAKKNSNIPVTSHVNHRSSASFIRKLRFQIPFLQGNDVAAHISNEGNGRDASPPRIPGSEWLGWAVLFKHFMASTCSNQGC